jgi:sec-independent protein translocase protein TatC
MLLLTKIGVIRAQTFARKRKFAIVSAIVLAAFITPTQDAFNLTLCTVPLIALYEIGIIVCRLAERGKAKPAEPEEDEPAG